MANSFTNVLPTIIAQSVQALREMAVMTRLVNRDYANTPAGWGDVVNVTIPTAGTVSTVTPGVTLPTGGDSTPVKVPITLSQWKKTSMYLTDKEVGQITDGIRPSEVTEKVRALANNVNSYMYLLYKKVYGFAGTPGTTPFTTGGSADILSARKVLNQQLAPMNDRRVVLDPSAEALALGVSDIMRADARGTGEAIMAGRIATTYGMDWFMDQLLPRHVSTALTAGACTVNGVNAAGAGSTDNNRTGTVSIAKATNAAPLVAGDIITIAGDSQTYVVLADVTLAVGNTSVSIAPALKQATAGGEAVTLKASHQINLVFQRDAIMFASRMLSDVGGIANTFTVPDPITGLVLRGEIVRESKQSVIEWDILYGAELVRPELAVRLAGA